jgi:glycerol-3-phosphate responsive antiterminator
MDNIDTRFCDLIEGATNKETPRQFIRNTEEELGIRPADIDNMSEDELNVYIDRLDDLWGK